MSAVDPTAGDAVPAATSGAVPARTYVTWTALALMTVSSVASLRPAPTMALYGLACVFLYVLPAFIFLTPTALISAKFASGWSGGLSAGSPRASPPNMGSVAARHQCAMKIFYYLTLLSFVAPPRSPR